MSIHYFQLILVKNHKVDVLHAGEIIKIIENACRYGPFFLCVVIMNYVMCGALCFFEDFLCRTLGNVRRRSCYEY